MSVLFYGLAAAILVILNAAGAIIGRIIYVVKKQNKMYANITELLEKLKSESEDNSYERILKQKGLQRPLYDYILKTKNYAYYIKLIQNNNLNEITVQSSVKWKMRRGTKSTIYISDIEEFMRLRIPDENNVISKKIVLVYPDSKSLLRYINECELEFITPDTDVYGCNVVTYKQLNENLDIIKL
ncbi:MAG: hypothetical protein IJU60_07065 [Acholeplasmatales bacterium]|nr:hypothetical protein [Acholeplasmatales bacterium]